MTPTPRELIAAWRERERALSVRADAAENAKNSIYARALAGQAERIAICADELASSLGEGAQPDRPQPMDNDQSNRSQPVERCEGRYPVPQTAPPRDEPFEVTYRCGLLKGHSGPHGSGDPVQAQVREGAQPQESQQAAFEAGWNAHCDAQTESGPAQDVDEAWAAWAASSQEP